MKTIFFLEKSTVFPFEKHSFSTDKAYIFAQKMICLAIVTHYFILIDESFEAF